MMHQAAIVSPSDDSSDKKIARKKQTGMKGQCSGSRWIDLEAQRRFERDPPPSLFSTIHADKKISGRRRQRRLCDARQERRNERKKEWCVYAMPRVTELTVCQPNTGSMVQLPLLFIPPVDYLAGIYARTRDTPTQHLPHPLLPIHPTLCRGTPTRKSITYPTPAAAVLIFYQRRREIYKNTPARTVTGEDRCKIHGFMR